MHMIPFRIGISIRCKDLLKNLIDVFPDHSWVSIIRSVSLAVLTELHYIDLINL